MKEFAKYLLAQEISAGDGAAAFRICDTLRDSLSSLMGVAGYRSLFSRALALASADVPWLRELNLKTDGRLEGVAEAKAKLDAEQFTAGEVALVAQLVGLLVMFIGATLTLQLMHDAWPDADFRQFDF